MRGIKLQYKVMIDNEWELKSCGSVWSMFEMPVCIWLAMQKDGNPFMKFTCMGKNGFTRVKKFTCMTKIFHVCKKVHMHGRNSHTQQNYFT